jgi:hypothetical protein
MYEATPVQRTPPDPSPDPSPDPRGFVVFSLFPAFSVISISFRVYSHASKRRTPYNIEIDPLHTTSNYTNVELHQR